MNRAPTLCSLFFAAAVFAACTLDVGDFAGKSCASAADCPANYGCVFARPGQTSTCEFLLAPEIIDAGDDTPAFYCTDVKPALDRTCVSNCHGADTTGSGVATFRLDQYDDANGIQGAKSKAPNINARVAVDTMPPIGIQPRPSDDERAKIARWVAQGAPFCADGGTGGDGGS